MGGAEFSFKNNYPRNPGDAVGTLFAGSMESFLYENPLPISDRSSLPYVLAGINQRFSVSPRLPSGNIAKGTVVRSVAVKDGYIPSAVQTKSYFVNPSGTNQYELPVVSLSIEADDLVGYEKGIAVAGQLADQWRADNPEKAYSDGIPIPANFYSKGDDWERPGNIEFFNFPHTSDFSADCGIRIHGASSRIHPRKSFRLYFRSQYGVDQVQANIFEDSPIPHPTGALITEFHRLLLRNSGNKADGTRLFHDGFVQSLTRGLDLDAQAYQPVISFINGEYWGIINLRERQDKYYFATHYDIDPEDVVILSSAYGDEVSTGSPSDLADFSSIVDFAKKNDLAVSANYEFIESKVDLKNLINYFAFNIYIANTDWPHNNMDLWRVRRDENDFSLGSGRDGRWRWIIYDTDFAFSSNTQALETMKRSTGGASSSSLFKALLANEVFRNDFINSFADMINTRFLPEYVGTRVDEMAAQIEGSMSEHIKRWGVYTSDISTLKTFAAARPSYAREMVSDYFGLAGMANITLSCGGEGGHLKINDTELTGETPGVADTPYPWTGAYYKGIPVSVSAIPEAGHRFVGWMVRPTGTPTPEGEPIFYSTDKLISLDLAGDTTVQAVFEALPSSVLPTSIHSWNFEAAGSFLLPSQTIGGASLVVQPGPTTEVLRNTASQDFENAHLRVNNPLGAEIIIGAPTLGHQYIRVEYETRRSGQGAGDHMVEYTTDGVAWTVLQTYPVLDAAPQKQSLDFTEIPAAGDNPDFALRITFSLGAGGTAGNNRFDNIVVSGVPIPGAPVVNQEAVPVAPLLAGQNLQVGLTNLFTVTNPSAVNFSATSSAPSVASVAIQDEVLTITPHAAGEVTVTVTADDGDFDPVNASFTLLVYPAAHHLAASPFAFTAWAADAPAMTYPDHMLFLQSEVNDPGLATSLDRAYQIPLADAATPADAEFPYAASSRTRINGLDENGIAFINTGRGRDVGAALVALDTTSVERATVAFTAGTLTPNVRVYAIRLQYRVGSEGEFADVTDAEGQPVEYVRNATGGHALDIGPLELPPEAMGQPYVQLLWRYYFVSGGSGARAQLRLDNISIAAVVPSGFDAWQMSQYPDEAERLLKGGEMMDSDGSGIVNLMRYALGLSRDTQAAPYLPALEYGAGGWAYSFPVDASVDDIRYRVTESTDLNDWSTVLWDSDLHEFADLIQDGWLVIPVDSNAAKKFYRLEIERK